MITPEVDELSKKGAAMLVPLDGARFERGYIDAMVKGHADALAKIDNELLKAANETVKNHLTKTRAAVAEHLAKAKALQAKH